MKCKKDMKGNKRTILFSVMGLVFSWVTVTGSDAQTLRKKDKELVQNTAQLFVNRMLESRDIRPLITDMFSSHYSRRYACETRDGTDTFFSQLNAAERDRYFRVDVNLAYLVAIDTIARSNASNRELFESILSTDSARTLRQLVGSTGSPLTFTDHHEFQSQIMSIEKELDRVIRSMTTRQMERSKWFRERLDNRITDLGLGYMVELVESQAYADLCPEIRGFDSKSPMYYVTTPLFFGLVMIKSGQKMEIVAVTMADDD